MKDEADSFRDSARRAYARRRLLELYLVTFRKQEPSLTVEDIKFGAHVELDLELERIAERAWLHEPSSRG